MRERTGSRPALLLGWSAVAYLLLAVIAAATEPTAQSLLERTRELGRTTRKWTDRTQHLKLRIIDRRGGERQREVVITVKKYPEERTRSLLLFAAPQDVKGVGVLQWGDPKGTDEQWLYVPEVKRIRRISGSAKRESFVGTDFTYEDLAIITQITDWTDTEARATLLRDDEIDKQKYHVIEFTPTGKDLSYGKLLVWLRADDLLLLRFEMSDKTGQVQKRLTLADVRPVGTIPSAFRMEMTNLQSGSHTVVEFSDIKYDSGLDDGAFTQGALEHGL